MAFEQAALKVEKQQEFAELQAAVEQAFRPENAEKFLKQMDRKGLRIRDFDGVLRGEEADGEAWMKSCAEVGKYGAGFVSGAAGFRSGADAGVLSVEARDSRPRAAAQI